jgi:hypothetical protein
MNKDKSLQVVFRGETGWFSITVVNKNTTVSGCNFGFLRFEEKAVLF